LYKSVPQLVDYRKAERAPVVFLGYSLFELEDYYGVRYHEVLGEVSLVPSAF
jgi:hypothetical protein